MRRFAAAACVMGAITLSFAADAKAPALRITKTGFEVAGVDAALLAKVAAAKPTVDEWAALFAVYVGDAKDRPAIAGDYTIEKDVLRFQPRYGIEAGLRYRAVFHAGRLPGSTGAKSIEAEFSVPKPPPGPATVVEHVYPSASTLPENQLKFYLHFSAPMGRGEAYERVHLLDAKGKEVAIPFLELGEELWDPSGKRFTLFFDPGRIKRGLKPREDLGPALIEGGSYTLVIDAAWRDAKGNPLKEGHRKSFKVAPPDDTQPDPKKWKLTPPAGKQDALVVAFPDPMDHAMLQRVLWVVDATGAKVPGAISVTHDEMRWSFKSDKPWAAGKYELVVETIVEDLAGNSIHKPFEVDIFHPVQRKVESATVKLPFEVKP